MTAAVVYLARGRDAGTAAAERFIASYDAQEAGAPHRLVVAAKGWEEDPAGLAALGAAAARRGAALVPLPDDGYDWGAYIRIARMLEEDALLFLNSHSELLGPGWLALLQAALARPGVGAAGATGSWAALRPSPGLAWRMSRAAGRPLWRSSLSALAAFAAAARGRGRRPAFPNPHLRSNAFLIRRERFLAFAERRAMPAAKADAWELESGPGGLTRWLAAEGLGVVVVGRSGRVHASADWPESGTFRARDQADLLVADNQTRAYAAADAAGRRLLEVATWGRATTPASEA